MVLGDQWDPGHLEPGTNCTHAKKMGKIGLDWPLRLKNRAKFRAGFLLYKSKIANSNLVKDLIFWLQFRQYQKIQIRGGPKKGQKKCTGSVVFSFKGLLCLKKPMI